MPSAFGTLLSELIRVRGISLRSFSAALGKSQGNISNIIKGAEYTPPLDELDQWADFLELKGDKRAEFLELAYLEHCPEPIRKEYLRQKAVIAKMEERISRLEKR
jgi:transcriptional regulator with XRE-family HTH domain